MAGWSAPWRIPGWSSTRPPSGRPLREDGPARRQPGHAGRRHSEVVRHGLRLQLRSWLSSPLSLALVGLVVLVLLAGIVGHVGDQSPTASAAPASSAPTAQGGSTAEPASGPVSPSSTAVTTPAITPEPQLPGGG